MSLFAFALVPVLNILVLHPGAGANADVSKKLTDAFTTTVVTESAPPVFDHCKLSITSDGEKAERVACYGFTSLLPDDVSVHVGDKTINIHSPL